MNLSAPQVPSSRAQPRDLYCTAAICTHAPSLKRHLGASFLPFPRSRFTALQEGSLYFGPHDTQERRIVSYRFSYRCVELCLFESPRAYSLGTVSHWLSYHSHPIRPCGAPSPRGEGYDARIPSSKKGGEAATRALNPEANESKQKAHPDGCAFS